MANTGNLATDLSGVLTAIATVDTEVDAIRAVDIPACGVLMVNVNDTADAIRAVDVPALTAGIDILEGYFDVPIFHDKTPLLENLSGIDTANLVLNTALTQAIVSDWTKRYTGAAAWCYSIEGTGVIPQFGNDPSCFFIQSGTAVNDASGIAAVYPCLILPALSDVMFPKDLKLVFEWYGFIESTNYAGNTHGFFIGLAGLSGMQGATFAGVFESKAHVQRRFGFSSNNSADRKIVGVCGDGANVTNTAEFDTVFNEIHVYKMVYTIGTQIEYFLDNVSKGVINTTLPVSGVTLNPKFYFPVVTTEKISSATQMRMYGCRCYYTEN